MFPKPYIEYLAHFHGSRDYFECHEILEEYWKEDPPGRRKQIWVGLIQVAVALYHQRRNNFGGAARMMQKAIRIIEREKRETGLLGLDPDSLLQILKEREIEILKQLPFADLDLPISDQHLLEECKNRCSRHGWSWKKSSDLANPGLIHRHTLRDRSEVIEERARQKALRQNRGQ